MYGVMKVTTLLLVVVLMSTSAMEEFMPSEEDATLRNIIRTPEHILVGSSSFLYRLSTTLSVEERLALTAENRLLVADNRTYNGNFLSCDNSRCFLAEIGNFANMSWQVLSDSTLVREGTMNLHGLFVPSSSGTSELIFAETANGQAGRRVVRGGLSDVVFSSALSPPENSAFDLLASRTENRVLDPITYYTQFTHDRFIYFVHDPVRSESSIRVQRFCIEDSGEDNLVFASHIEIRLACGDSEGLLTAAHFVASPLLSDPTLIVSKSVSVGSDRVRVDVCTFSVPEIDRLMMEKFRECVEGRGDAGFSRQGGQSGCTRADNLENALMMICRFPGPARQGLEVTDPFERPAFFSRDFPMTEHFTSLTTTEVEGSLFLFAGSSSAQLYQYHLTDSSATFIRAVSLGSPQANITALLPSQEGEHIYAMSPNKLVRHQVDQCHTLTSCSSCVNSGDPICGWCALSGRCVRSKNCEELEGGLKIFVTTAALCPAIERTEPNIVYFQQLVPITLTAVNIQGTDAEQFTYDCVFRFPPPHPPIVRATDSTRSVGNTFECVALGLDDIPALPAGEDTVSAEVSLQAMETQVDIAVLEAALPFTDCSIHTSCLSCINSGVSKCKWCPATFQCEPNLDSFSCPRAAVTATQNVCQSILPPSDAATSNYMVHSGFMYPTSPLPINSIGLNSDLRLSCRICETDSCANVIRETSAEFLAGDVVQCNLNSINITLSKNISSVDLIIQVLIDDFVIDNPNNTRVTVYSCGFVGSNCAQCLSLPEQYGCSYCGRELNMEGNCVFTDTNFCSALEMFERIQDCDAPQITDFFPKSGPIRGGTEITVVGRNLGIEKTDIRSARIGGFPCTLRDYNPGVSFSCVTGPVGSIINMPIIVDLSFHNELLRSEDTFQYLLPQVTAPVEPSMGPRSGGTLVKITGRDLGSGSSRNVSIRGQVCVVKSFDQNSIYCVTPRNEPSIQNVLELYVDSWNGQASSFDYFEDPTFTTISPNNSFVAGGTIYIVTGERFNIIQAPQLLMYVSASGSNRRRRQADTTAQLFESEPCEVTNSTSMRCKAPSLSSLDDALFPLTVQMGLRLDAVSSLLMIDTTTLTIHQNPRVEPFSDMEFSRDVFSLTIEGDRFLFTPEQVKVKIAPCMESLCLCTVMEVAPNSLICEVGDPEDLVESQDLTVTVSVGNFSARAGTIRIMSNNSLLVILIPAFAGFLILLVVFLIVICAVFCRKAKQKDQRYDQLMMELERLESSVARECKLGFAELQTDLDELTGDVAGCRLPYHDLQTFLLATLFPDYKDHPILHHVQVPSHQRPLMMRALKDFNELLNDRKVLLIFIQSLEEERSFSIRDKSTVGSLLIVALHNRMDYATDVLKKLLTQLIRKTVSHSIPKLLLRRTESIAEKMLTNWLAICLQGYIMEHAGQPMYLLYRAVKNQLEKGPVDVITGEARYSLSEQKLIRQKMDVVPFNATVEMEDGLRVPVKLLDCDTISQAKEKLLDSMHKAAPVSRRPKLTEVDLEYLKTPSETMILRDEDHSTVVEGGWKKINTLRHYWVQDGAMFRMKPRKEYAPPGRVFDYPGSIISTHAPRQRALSEAEDGSRVWHLFKQIDQEDPKRSPFLNKKMVSEIYLPRMLSTKSILQNFVDELFNALFSNAHAPSSPSTAATFPLSPGTQVPMGYAPGADTVPMAVKYLFDFLDDAAEDCKIMDGDVVHTWKNNALALRFWVNMIKNPEFVFDINKSHTVDACLSVIAQAFIDGCSSAEAKLNIDSPTSKLLYNKEVQGYKNKVKKFYSDVKQMPRIPEDAMQYYLRQLSEYQAQQMRKTGGFVTDSAVNELLRYATHYSTPFLRNLRNAGLQQRASQFESVLNIVKPPSNGQVV